MKLYETNYICVQLFQYYKCSFKVFSRIQYEYGAYGEEKIHLSINNSRYKLHHLQNVIEICCCLQIVRVYLPSEY